MAVATILLQLELVASGPLLGLTFSRMGKGDDAVVRIGVQVMAERLAGLKH